MSVNNNINIVIFQNTQVCFSQDRSRGSEQNVRYIRSNQAAAPAISNSSAYRVVQNMFCILVIADMGSVQTFDYLAVDSPGKNSEFFPNFTALIRRPNYWRNQAALLAKLGDVQIGQIVGYFVGGAIFNRNVVIRGKIPEFSDIPDNIALSFAIGCFLQSDRHITPMIRVSRCSSSHHTNKVAGLDSIRCRSTNPGLSRFHNSAGTHAANFAA